MSTAPPPPPDWPGRRNEQPSAAGQEPSAPYPQTWRQAEPERSTESESAPPPAQGIGTAFIVIAMLLALAVLSLIFDRALTRRANPNQDVIGTVAGDVAEVRLLRGSDGHYRAIGEINGERTEMLLDTGATSISLGSALARRLQLQPLGRVRLQTANGAVEGTVVLLEEVRLGPIVERNIEAVVSPGLDDEVLLGMNFLKPLEWNQRNSELILRQRQR